MPNSEFPILQAVSLQAAIQCAATEPQCFGRLADVAVEPCHRLLDEEALDLLEAHILDARRGIAIDPQPELAEADRSALRHQDAALHRVIQLADVAGPRVIQQRLKRRRLEAREVL